MGCTLSRVRMRWAFAGFSVYVVATSAIASCVTTPSADELAAQRVIVTQFAPNTDFTAYRTFAMTEEIDVIVEGVDGGNESRTVDPALATPFLDAIAHELEQRGYRRVGRTDKPDLGVAVDGVIRAKAAVSYGAWWGYGAATPGYWGYGGAALSSGTISGGVAIWKVGAIVIELYDLRAARDGNAAAVPISAAPPGAAPSDAGPPPPPIPVVWSAFLYGVIGEVEAETKPIAAMQQAFAQSPYLKGTP